MKLFSYVWHSDLFLLFFLLLCFFSLKLVFYPISSCLFSLHINYTIVKKIFSSCSRIAKCILIQSKCIFSSVQSLTCVQLFATPWTAARQASLSITNSQSLLKLMSTESVMPSNHLILCHPLLFLPSIFPSITVFSGESVLCIR